MSPENFDDRMKRVLGLPTAAQEKERLDQEAAAREALAADMPRREALKQQFQVTILSHARQVAAQIAPIAQQARLSLEQQPTFPDRNVIDEVAYSLAGGDRQKRRSTPLSFFLPLDGLALAGTRELMVSPPLVPAKVDIVRLGFQQPNLHEAIQDLFEAYVRAAMEGFRQSR